RLLEYDDVMNKQREVIYKRRHNALFGERLEVDIANMIFDVSASIVQSNKDFEDFGQYELDLIKYFTMGTPVTEDEFRSKSIKDLTNITYEAAVADYKVRMKYVAETAFPVISGVFENQGHMFSRIQVPFTDGIREMTVVCDLKEAYESHAKTLIKDFEKSVVLSLIDDNWKEHLRDVDDLRKTSQNAVYEQKDPLVVYKQESFHIFQRMLDTVNKEIISFLFKGELPNAQKPESVEEAEIVN
ncbi:MAG: preprotein translocase subunit SecA, partial [Algoriella sp.]